MQGDLEDGWMLMTDNWLRGEREMVDDVVRSCMICLERGCLIDDTGSNQMAASARTLRPERSAESRLASKARYLCTQVDS